MVEIVVSKSSRSYTWLAQLMVIAGVLVLLIPGQVRAQARREVVGNDKVHIVAAGENLYTIAQSYGLAIEHLAFANGLSAASVNVEVGEELVIPKRRVLPANPPSNGLVVNLPERGVFLFRDGSFCKFYPIAIGQPGRFSTPRGNYAIANKAVDPVWLPPEWAGQGEEPVPAGPGNPLGDRWIGLTAPGIGLHSTNAPMSVGQAASHGCMRMYPLSVRELFGSVEVGWPVRIEYETSKAGYDANTGRFYVVSFPDVYGLKRTSVAAKEVLLASGLEVSASDLAEISRPTGVAVELMVDAVDIVVGDKPQEWPTPASVIDGSVWGSVKIASAAGLTVVWDAENKAVEISKGHTTLVFPVNAGYVLDPGKIKAGYNWRIAGAARQVGGQTIIPMRRLLDGFSIPNQWDSSQRVLRICPVN